MNKLASIAAVGASAIGSLVGVISSCALLSLNKEFKDAKQELLKNSKPITEATHHLFVTTNGDTVKLDKIDTVAYYVPVKELQKLSPK